MDFKYTAPWPENPQQNTPYNKSLYRRMFTLLDKKMETFISKLAELCPGDVNASIVHSNTTESISSKLPINFVQFKHGNSNKKSFLVVRNPSTQHETIDILDFSQLYTNTTNASSDVTSTSVTAQKVWEVPISKRRINQIFLDLYSIDNVREHNVPYFTYSF